MGTPIFFRVWGHGHIMAINAPFLKIKRGLQYSFSYKKGGVRYYAWALSFNPFKL
jgi:hypothetical protein